MPHLFVNRERVHDVVNQKPELKQQFLWETINAIVYKIGGIIFIAGSVCFLPRFEAHVDLGAILFVIGSILYLIVSLHDIIEVNTYRKKNNEYSRELHLEYIASFCYFIGSVLFTAGSIFFLKEVDMVTAGAWMFIIGSGLFVYGAATNVARILYEGSTLTLQLMNLTALTFVVGSVLFLIASVPYLWHIDTGHDSYQLFRYLAWQYIIGSALFLLGGFTNYWRAFLIMRHQLNEAEQLIKDTKQNKIDK
ncbi:YrhK family protein [Vibrio sp. SS-MA-C1-2]|uniref:YrhK family protein n=1 Tax=Vibrio sp. SS-MA-C1-2 TaxID=2908646 RepID=UPI001F1A88E8|nr:YrhK family protein [Vibrio sp. SS-MA-C1-2]UJF18381.1 YrhK family protein [Vibrio sp. SS-MA-C1-2]